MTGERTRTTTPREAADGTDPAPACPSCTRPAAPRRALLAAGAAALAGTALAGCGGSGDGGGSAEETGPEQDPQKDPSKDPAENEGNTDQPAPGGELASTSEIPVGGGKVFTDEKVVVTQPEKGTFKAFSAVCTHQGCTVKDVAGDTINCTCHGSKFRIDDASVADGPATRPLPAKKITVSGDTISLA